MKCKISYAAPLERKWLDPLFRIFRNVAPVPVCHRSPPGGSEAQCGENTDSDHP